MKKLIAALLITVFLSGCFGRGVKGKVEIEDADGTTITIEDTKGE
jgi:PBP1b-binding outer membrane lipoprotein LpoB